MRLIAMTTLAVALGCGIALAQAPSGGGPSGGSSSGGAPSGAAPSGSSPGTAPAAPGNPAANPALPPAGAPSRSNTEVFPPSRGLQSPSPSPRATAPGGLTQPGATNPSANTNTGASTPGAPQPGGGSPTPGGASSSAQSRDNKTGKNTLNEEYTDCMRLWDAGTHMGKQEWSATCRRVQSRLNQVQSK